MYITARGWGRDLGETTLVSASVSEAVEPGDRLSRGQLYKRILHQDDRRRTKVQLYSAAEMRLGGTYLLRLELSRREIAQLFYETHSGSMVRMVQAFIEGEDHQDRVDQLAKIARRDERWKQMLEENEQSEKGDIS